jgi:deoxyribodipyrimidine photo-lyase
MVPSLRISPLNDHAVRADGDYVLYWMVAARRTSWNFALDRAVEHAGAMRKPVVILEALRRDYPWASERLHQFAVDGMRDNLQACQAHGVLYYPYLEAARGEGKGLLERLAERAAVVVTDEFPGFFLPRMLAAAARKLPVRLEAVDSNGLLPLRAVTTAMPSAYTFRRALQKTLPAHLGDRPRRDPLASAAMPKPALPDDVRSRWAPAMEWLEAGGMARFPVDHSVSAVAARGGECAARARLQAFVANDLDSYGVERNQPDNDRSSRLSAYLHWGHLSVHEVFEAVTGREGWLGALPATATGAREGWWGLSRAAESFLDELIVWRELGYNMSSKRADAERFDSLPSWAINTLSKHQADARDPLYPLAVFEEARTHDPLWNAAQRQLRTEGRLQNYLRMLWGKKILEWSASPREALRIMVELNNKYALDGRDPNSISGIFWVLGRYDRPWLPERPVYGAIRYMSSENTARKLRVREYLRRYAG